MSAFARKGFGKGRGNNSVRCEVHTQGQIFDVAVPMYIPSFYAGQSIRHSEAQINVSNFCGYLSNSASCQVHASNAFFSRPLWSLYFLHECCHGDLSCGRGGESLFGSHKDNAKGKDERSLAALTVVLGKLNEDLQKVRETLLDSFRKTEYLGDLLDAYKNGYRRCQEELWDC